MDEEGLLVDRVRETILARRKEGRTVKFIYTIPEFQNPSGRTMSLARRRELIRVARELNVLILEDQPYRDLRFMGRRISASARPLSGSGSSPAGRLPSAGLPPSRRRN